MPEDRAEPHRERATLTMGVVVVATVAALLAGILGLRDWYWLGAAAFVLIVILLIGRRPRGRHAIAAEPDGFQRLVALCYNDRAMVDRLVAGERRRAPELNQQALVERAIERLRDDRRR